MAPGDAAVPDARFGGRDDEPAEWVSVYVAATLEQAHVIKGALEAADVPAVLRYESLGMVVAAALTIRGVDVLVPRALEDHARAVLGGAGAPDGPGSRRRRRGGRSERA